MVKSGSGFSEDGLLVTEALMTSFCISTKDLMADLISMTSLVMRSMTSVKSSNLWPNLVTVMRTDLEDLSDSLKQMPPNHA